MTRLLLSASALAALAGAGALSCSDPAAPCFCTEEFRIYTVRVVDDAGNPVSDLAITRVLVRTGQVLEPGWLGLLEPGVYLIADDSMREVFQSGGDVVRVTADKDGGSVVMDFRFAVPAPCRCHVEKLAGPDTVVFP